MSRFFYAQEIARPEDVIPHLAKQELHWKKGYSAYELAHCWVNADIHLSLMDTYSLSTTFKPGPAINLLARAGSRDAYVRSAFRPRRIPDDECRARTLLPEWRAGAQSLRRVKPLAG